MSTVPSSAPSPEGHRPAGGRTGGAARRALRRLTLGSGPLKRKTDRVEVLSRLLLAIVLVLAAPVALAVANAAATDLRATAASGATTRNPGLAVLLEDAASRPGAGSGTHAAGTTTPTDGTWTAPDGTTREGEVPALFGSRAGDAVRVWIDEDGALTRAPLRDSSVTAVTVVTGGGTFVLVVALACAAHGLVCWTLNRRRDRRWSADWAEVEPTWSSRLR